MDKNDVMHDLQIIARCTVDCYRVLQGGSHGSSSTWNPIFGPLAEAFPIRVKFVNFLIQR